MVLPVAKASYAYSPNFVGLGVTGGRRNGFADKALTGTVTATPQLQPAEKTAPSERSAQGLEISRFRVEVFGFRL